VRRGSWADAAHTAAVRTVADKGVISVRQLVGLGVPETTVYRRCRPGGPWQLLLPAVVMLSTGSPTRDQLVAGALRYAGEDSLVTGVEACRRHGVRRGLPTHDTVHLLVPHARQPRSTRFVVIERTWRPPDPVMRSGVPLAPVARAAVDAVRRFADPGNVTELLADAVQRGLCTVQDLVHEVEDCQRRGTAVPRRVLDGVGAGARSAAELDAKRLWARSGLPEPWWNAPVYDVGGRLLGVVDAWFDEVALAWEINSVEWHLNPENYAREQERTARLIAEGVPVLPTQPRRMRTAAGVVVDELRAAYTHAAARPRPPVLVRRTRRLRPRSYACVTRAAPRTAAATALTTAGSKTLGTMNDGLGSSTTSAIAVEAASSMASVMSRACASSRPRKIPGKASTLLIWFG
jgi:hypothetical protein